MIVVVGVSHRTAPIDVRELLAFSSEEAGQLSERLVGEPSVSEAFVVSTCNRVEVVAASPDDACAEACAAACRDEILRRSPGASSHLYVHRGLEGMQHLARVAASLDSLVVGEPQILGQLKQGFELGREHGTVGSELHRAFSRAARGAKLVRSQTGIGSGQVSVPSIAVELAKQIFGDLSRHTALLVGSGEMGQTVARLLHDAGAQLIVVGRSVERAGVVAEQVDGEALAMDQLDDALRSADVVVTSTSAPHAIIGREQVKRMVKARRGRNVFFIDLAVPRDVEAGVSELDGVFLYNVDDLAEVAEKTFSTRQREAERAHELVDGVVRDWQRWSDAQQATPTIKALRARLRVALEAEMQRSLRGRLRDLDGEQRAALAKMLDAGINRILHAPSVRLREEATAASSTSLGELTETLSELFELDDLPEESLDASSIYPPDIGAPPSSG